MIRACRECRRKRIKCDAATTNTWPCSACIRLKLSCARPNGHDGATESQVYEPPQTQSNSTPLVQESSQQAPPLQKRQLLTQTSKSASICPSQRLYQHDIQQQLGSWVQQPQVSCLSHPIDGQINSPGMQSPGVITSSQPGPTSALPLSDASQWDPTCILEYVF